jgi:hypothetical protein
MLANWPHPHCKVPTIGDGEISGRVRKLSDRTELYVSVRS